jgi:hypothetical protein
MLRATVPPGQAKIAFGTFFGAARLRHAQAHI